MQRQLIFSDWIFFFPAADHGFLLWFLMLDQIPAAAAAAAHLF
jgi:hypothetical protein